MIWWILVGVDHSVSAVQPCGLNWSFYAGRKWHLGSKKEKLLDQMEKDAMFLASLNIMDYSLLVRVVYHFSVKRCSICRMMSLQVGIHDRKISNLQKDRDLESLVAVPPPPAQQQAHIQREAVDRLEEQEEQHLSGGADGGSGQDGASVHSSSQSGSRHDSSAHEPTGPVSLQGGNIVATTLTHTYIVPVNPPSVPPSSQPPSINVSQHIHHHAHSVSQPHSQTPFRLHLASLKEGSSSSQPTPSNPGIPLSARSDTGSVGDAGSGPNNSSHQASTHAHTQSTPQRPHTGRRASERSASHPPPVHPRAFSISTDTNSVASSTAGVGVPSVNADDIGIRMSLSFDEAQGPSQPQSSSRQNSSQGAPQGDEPGKISKQGSNSSIAYQQQSSEDEEDYEEEEYVDEDDDEYDDESDVSDSVFGDGNVPPNGHASHNAGRASRNAHNNKTLSNDEINEREINHLKEILGLGAKGVEGAKVAQLFVSADRFAQMTATTIQRDVELVRHMSTIQLRQKNVFVTRPWTNRHDGGS
jgi:ribosomal protein L12E/L44/L45/RPP1/RPP2